MERPPSFGGLLHLRVFGRSSAKGVSLRKKVENTRLWGHGKDPSGLTGL
jgi:hypothetical protein